MPTRRDQLQAYQFMMRRVTSALIVHETDPELAPLRRGVGAVFAGVMIAVLIAAGFGVYGVFTGIGGTSWRADGSVIVEKETGATYVYLGDSLQPVLNITSGRLLGNMSDPEPHRVSAADLEGIPRNPMVGIPGAPASLPSAEQALGAPWTMCSVLAENTAGVPTPSTALLVGGEIPDGSPLRDRGVLVRDVETGTNYLVWNNRHYRIAGDRPEAVLRSVFGADLEIVDAGTAWLNGLPAGQDIGPIDIEGRGQPSSIADDLAVGDVVFHAAGDGRQHYLVRTDGLAPLTELQVRILRGQYSVTPKEISPSLANEAPASDAPAPASGEAAPPESPPELVRIPGEGPVALCSRTDSASSGPVISIGGDVSALDAGVQTSAETPAGVRLADRVLVPPGGVAVVRALPSDGSGPGALSIVTDLGMRFAVPSPDVLAALGYSDAMAVDMPATLVQRIPAGPALNPATALRPAQQSP
ncbi:type VII secretion protein EccB, Actinobacterial [Saccharomonospora marina XMU15]|uniref:Type VII secretion protein EccB, Actinobacterial n=1 Tax=Saccharomonospora marina XMU15 TaxID=882083 RepID=H5X097_9PSEU|nr:type VII secretion protein EccB [Saccharomonospora marina]EHR48557.1 type VII secretion protein EccB, Actinobacterial [Saccharomonospora marina XMU15]